MNQNLKPITNKEQARRLGRKGGLSKSPRKRIASKINGHRSNKKLTESQKAYLKCLYDKDLFGLLEEIISDLLATTKTRKERLQIVDRIIKIIPDKSLIVMQKEEKQKEQKIDWNDVIINILDKGEEEKT